MSITRLEVLKLYKNLIKYSKCLTFTDPLYFRQRISTEFKRNKGLNKEEEIRFAFQSGQMLRTLTAAKHSIDYSRVPTINEFDLTEQFVRGGGPGGSAVNKNANCVVLTHMPTGTVVKCHISRCQDENRKLAREMLISKLDEEQNGENSVIAQKKRMQDKKVKKNEYKKKKKAFLKEEWKKREGLL